MPENKSILEEQAVHVAPVEFGEGLRQFLVERTSGGWAFGLVPLVVWVEAELGAQFGDGSTCGCPGAHALTSQSERYVRALKPTYDLAHKYQPCVCPKHHGRFLE